MTKKKKNTGNADVITINVFMFVSLFTPKIVIKKEARSHHGSSLLLLDRCLAYYFSVTLKRLHLKNKSRF